MYKNWGCKSFDLLLAFIDRSMSDNFYCLSLNFCFGNIKIARYLTSVVVDHPMHNTNYYQAPMLESLFVNLFTMSYSQRPLIKITMFMRQSSPLWWNYYFFPAFRKFLLFYYNISFDDLLDF